MCGVEKILYVVPLISFILFPTDPPTRLLQYSPVLRPVLVLRARLARGNR